MLEPSHAVVHADRLRHNALGVRSAVGDRLVLAAVKADAYGHGAVHVARFYEAQGLVDWLGVATVQEGLRLRDAGVRLPILKLSHVLTSRAARAAVAADISTACVSADNARLLSAVGESLGCPARVHLKIDTGMRRIGVEADGAADLAALVESLPGVELDGVFTHMPASDDPDEDDFSHEQVARFAAAVRAVHERIGRELPLVHMANSGAVLAHEDAWLTMVRPGIALYGYYPDAATPRTIDLQPVLEWRSRVSFVKDVPAGDSVGYGRTFVADDRTRVATVPVGYADGYPRVCSSAGSVLVGGVRAPIVGRVCMDQLMVAVGPDVRVGDEVVLIGSQGEASWTADDIARVAGTISYEVLCGIGARVPRELV